MASNFTFCVSEASVKQMRQGFLVLARGGGGTPLQEANGNVPLDGVAFSRLDWLEWGRKFSDFGGK